MVVMIILTSYGLMFAGWFFWLVGCCSWCELVLVVVINDTVFWFVFKSDGV